MIEFDDIFAFKIADVLLAPPPPIQRHTPVKRLSFVLLQFYKLEGALCSITLELLYLESAYLKHVSNPILE